MTSHIIFADTKYQKSSRNNDLITLFLIFFSNLYSSNKIGFKLLQKNFSLIKQLLNCVAKEPVFALLNNNSK